MTSFERVARAHIFSRGSPATKRLYLSDLSAWLVHCELENIEPDEPTLEVATTFRDKLAKRVGPQTVRRTLSALSSMYDAAGLTNHFRSSRRLARPEANEVALTQAFTKEEIGKLLTAVKAEAEKTIVGLRDLAVVLIMYETGLRISSVAGMQRDRLIRQDGQLSVLVKVKKKGLVEVVFPEKSMKALDRWLEVIEISRATHVFPALRGKKALSTRAINQRLEAYGKLTGIEDCNPHRFRATFITEALDAGIALHEVQAAVHHSDPKTTQRYDRGIRGTGVTKALDKFRGGRS